MILHLAVSPQNAIGKTLLRNEGNGDKITLPGSVTRPAEVGLTIFAVLCFLLGMDNSADKPNQNKTKSQDEGKDKLDCDVLNIGVR